MNRSLELPESIYTDLVRAAEASGTTPAGWIQEHLPKNGATGNGSDARDGEFAAADAALDDCLVSLGHARHGQRADRRRFDLRIRG